MSVYTTLYVGHFIKIARNPVTVDKTVRGCANCDKKCATTFCPNCGKETENITVKDRTSVGFLLVDYLCDNDHSDSYYEHFTEMENDQGLFLFAQSTVIGSTLNVDNFTQTPYRVDDYDRARVYFKMIIDFCDLYGIDYQLDNSIVAYLS